MFVLSTFIYDDRTVKGGVSTSRGTLLPPSAYQTPWSPRPWTRLSVAGLLRAGGPGRPWMSWRKCPAAWHSLSRAENSNERFLCLICWFFFLRTKPEAVCCHQVLLAWEMGTSGSALLLSDWEMDFCSLGLSYYICTIRGLAPIHCDVLITLSLRIKVASLQA